MKCLLCIPVSCCKNLPDLVLRSELQQGSFISTASHVRNEKVESVPFFATSEE